MIPIHYTIPGYDLVCESKPDPGNREQINYSSPCNRTCGADAGMEIPVCSGDMHSGFLGGIDGKYYEFLPE